MTDFFREDNIISYFVVTESVEACFKAAAAAA